MGDSSPKKNPSLRQLAKAAGVDPSTVSRVLRGQGRCSEATRKKILKAAEKLHYQPDPSVVRVMTRIRSNAPKQTSESIAYISHMSLEKKWKSLSLFKQAIEQRAQELGYQFAFFDADEKEFSAKRLSQILYSRGIQGVILSPISEEKPPVELQWEHFSVVAIGRSQAKSGLHRVYSDVWHSVNEVLSYFLTQNYQRIGMIYTAHENRKMECFPEAAWLIASRRPDKKRLLPLLLVERYNSENAIKRYVEKHQPDLIISHSTFFYNYLKSWGTKIPQKVGVFSLSDIPKQQSPISCLVPNHKRIGATAVELVSTLLAHNKLGLSESPHGVLVKPLLYPGKTVKKIELDAFKLYEKVSKNSLIGKK